MSECITIASPDPDFAQWLERYVGALRPYTELRTTPVESLIGPHGRTRTDPDAAAAAPDAGVLLLHTSFGCEPEDPGAEGFALLRRLGLVAERPVIVAIAEEGNELTAVSALRHGASDYLPRHMLTPERLAEALRNALNIAERRAAHARRERGETDSDPDGRRGSRAISLPHYEILRTLGRSELSTVYLAASADMDRNIALKVGAEIVDDGEQMREQLAREYQAIAAIVHPSIVDIYDYGVHDGREYLAMEYFPRGDLYARLRAPLSVAAGVAYVRKIAAALQVVHEAGLVHRDLKPQNVMLREDDEIVLIDFGLAKILDATQGSSTRTGRVRGSPYFMSPEQAQGLCVDRRADLYALGVVLFEVLMHRKPYYGDTAIDVLHRHVSEPIPRLSEDLACFQPIIDRLLAKKPDDRYESAADVGVLLAGY